MLRDATRKSQDRPTARQKPESRADATLIAIVRLLARQAAEKDYAALVKAQEAANDNE